MTKKYWVRKFLHLRKASKSNKFCKSAMLWIRIGFNADPNPAFLCQCGSDSSSSPRNMMTKNSTLLQLQNVSYFFYYQKLQYTIFIHSLHAGRPSYVQERPQAHKREYPAHQNNTFFNFFLICWVILHSQILNPDSADQSQYGSQRIRV